MKSEKERPALPATQFFSHQAQRLGSGTVSPLRTPSRKMKPRRTPLEDVQNQINEKKMNPLIVERA